MTRPGNLILVSGPIGNLGDISPRASDAIKNADFVIAEDTRVTGKLLAHLEVSKSMRRLNDQSSPSQIQTLADEIETGGNWVLLTDAGTPAISDPGAQLVDLLLESNVQVDCIPGPSAVTNALALSGFFAQRFAFLGFMPKKPGAIAELLLPYAESTFTLVFFESPHRFQKLLTEIEKNCGQRRYAICRELTKKHQQVYRNTLPNLPKANEVPAKGEFTIVVEGLRRVQKSPDQL